MKGDLRVIAVVPARGGDREVPYLNIKKLGGIPLIAHTLAEAEKSRYIDRCIVSTDDDQVARVAEEYRAEVPFRRPPELATDIPEIKTVITHAVREVERQESSRYDLVVTLQATSPFRTAEQIDQAIDKLVEEDLDAVISMKEIRSLTWRMVAGQLEPLYTRAGRRDELEPIYEEDGAVRVVRRAVLESDDRLGKRIGHILMDRMSSLTVHDIYDFWLAEKLEHLPRVLFRVDGGGSMGMGHVYRSVAVAQALRSVSHADICFLMSADFAEGVRHVSNAGFAVRVIPKSGDEIGPILEVIQDHSPNIIVNDRPRLDEAYLRALAGLGASTINLVDSLDDIERPKDIASVIIATMQEEQSDLEDYHGGIAILRDSFEDRIAKGTTIAANGRRVVLSFGGSDPQGLSLKTLKALEELPDVSVTLVLGPAFGYHRELDALLPTLSSKPNVLKNVEHMADILFEADLVICSGGMTVYEIAALGRPGIVLCQNGRELQRMEKVARYGSIVHLGLGTETSRESIAATARELLGDPLRRKRMSEAGAKLVDAKGTERVYEVMREQKKRGPANGGRWLS
jgi:CMP-N-acetylneuraminic acid synthetase/spore coat polysaccharide biosynthesis predicted glycosyltransferase SpsG